MASDSDAPPESATEDATPEPIRVLIPSPLGNLGVTFAEEVVTSVVIVPSASQRKTYTPLAKADPSDFLDEAIGHLSEYFAGARRQIGLEWRLESEELDDLARAVLTETANIPYGETRSYQQLAAAIGQPDSYRLVRSALMLNPIPILVPCHRVIPQRSGVGTYIAGTKKKEKLLRIEQKAQAELEARTES